MHAPSTPLALIFAVAGVGCADGTGDLSATPLDRTEPSNWAFYCEPEPGRLVAPGMSYGNGCNQCSCPAQLDDATCADGVCVGGPCTAALCNDPIPGACTSDLDCGPNGSCVFDAGCGDPSGRCVQVQLHTNQGAAEAYCTCDGRTVNLSTPLEPYAHAGPCA